MFINGYTNALFLHPSALGAYLTHAAPMPVSDRPQFLNTLDTFMDALAQRGVDVADKRKTLSAISSMAGTVYFRDDLKKIAQFLRQIPNPVYFAAAAHLMESAAMAFDLQGVEEKEIRKMRALIQIPDIWQIIRWGLLVYLVAIAESDGSRYEKMGDHFDRAGMEVKARTFYYQAGAVNLKWGRIAYAKARGGREQNYYRYAIDNFWDAWQYFEKALSDFQRSGSHVLPDKVKRLADEAERQLDFVAEMMKKNPGLLGKPVFTQAIFSVVGDAIKKPDDADLVYNARRILMGSREALASFLHEAGIIFGMEKDKLVEAMLHRNAYLLLGLRVLLKNDDALLERLLKSIA